MMTIIKQLREKYGLTRQDMAELLKISVSLYVKLDYGYRQPSVSVLKKIKKAFPETDMNIFFTHFGTGLTGIHSNLFR